MGYKHHEGTHRWKFNADQYAMAAEELRKKRGLSDSEIGILCGGVSREIVAQLRRAVKFYDEGDPESAAYEFIRTKISEETAKKRFAAAGMVWPSNRSTDAVEAPANGSKQATQPVEEQLSLFNISAEDEPEMVAAIDGIIRNLEQIKTILRRKESK